MANSNQSFSLFLKKPSFIWRGKIFLLSAHDLKDGAKKNFHHIVVEHREIKKAVVILKSAICSQRREASDVLKRFDHFRVIWDENKDLKVKVWRPAHITCFEF